MTDGREFNIDPTFRGVIKWGGFCLLISATVPIVFALSSFILKQALPVPAREALEHPLAPTALLLWAGFGELLLLPAGLALYFSLKGVERTLTLMATALWLLAVPVFLVARGPIIAIAQMSGRYMSTTDEAMKAAYLVSAEYTLQTQHVYGTMALSFLAIATIMLGLVMLKGVFGKHVGYLVMGAGIWTLAASISVNLGGAGILLLIGLVLTGIWELIVGARLYSLGKDLGYPPDPHVGRRTAEGA